MHCNDTQNYVLVKQNTSYILNKKEKVLCFVKWLGMLKETKSFFLGGGLLMAKHCLLRTARCTANTNQHQEIGTKFKSMGIFCILGFRY